MPVMLHSLRNPTLSGTSIKSAAVKGASEPYARATAVETKVEEQRLGAERGLTLLVGQVTAGLSF